MFSWCHNRLEITAKSVCLDVMQPWIAGMEKPLYRQAIRQATKLFLAGCAGILNPIRAMEYTPYPMLTAYGTGAQTSPNQAFQHFIELLEQDAWIDTKTVSRMEKIWLQSGINALKWEAVPLSARQIMAKLMAVHYAPERQWSITSKTQVAHSFPFFIRGAPCFAIHAGRPFPGVFSHTPDSNCFAGEGTH